MTTVQPRPGVTIAPATQLAVPAAARVLSLRLVCVRTVPGRTAGLPGPVLLAVGERGRDPDLVFGPGTGDAVVETQLCLAPGGAGFTVDGRYVTAGPGRPAMELRWGVSSPRGHFLLVSGLQLRLPRFVVGDDEPGPPSRMPVLTATVVVTDDEGLPLRGVVEAADVPWRLAGCASRTGDLEQVRR